MNRAGVVLNQKATVSQRVGFRLSGTVSIKTKHHEKKSFQTK